MKKSVLNLTLVIVGAFAFVALVSPAANADVCQDSSGARFRLRQPRVGAVTVLYGTRLRIAGFQQGQANGTYVVELVSILNPSQSMTAGCVVETPAPVNRQRQLGDDTNGSMPVEGQQMGGRPSMSGEGQQFGD